jgi:hypothetical protein
MEEDAMATTTHIPVEVYLRSSYEPDAEYVDGKIEERPVGEFDHASWQQAIQKWFWQHEKEWGIRVLPELRVQVAATRYRVPDVTVLDAAQPIEQIITHPPLAVFDVLSAEDSLQRLIDPQDSTFYRYENLQLARNDSFSHAEKGIIFDMNQLKNLLY